MVADDQILFAFPEHGGGHVRFVGILVDAFELAVLVGVGYRAQAVLVDQAVLQLAVFLFADSSVEWVNQIFDCAAVWQADCSQVAQAVVVSAVLLASVQSLINQFLFHHFTYFNTSFSSKENSMLSRYKFPSSSLAKTNSSGYSFSFF